MDRKATSTPSPRRRAPSSRERASPRATGSTIGARSSAIEPRPTLSKARRQDQFAKLQTVRTTERPEGVFGCKRVKFVNGVVNRVAEVCEQQLAAGRAFTLTHPAESYLWDLKAFRR